MNSQRERKRVKEPKDSFSFGETYSIVVLHRFSLHDPLRLDNAHKDYESLSRKADLALNQSCTLET